MAALAWLPEQARYICKQEGTKQSILCEAAIHEAQLHQPAQLRCAVLEPSRACLLRRKSNNVTPR